MENEEKKENVSIETRNIETMLRELREGKNWTYLNVVEELNKLGILTTEKLIRKWEIGLEYPNLDTIYKLSELYMVPSKDFIKAKSNSFEEGYNSINATLIKWFCYLTGASLKVGAVCVVGIYIIGLTWAFWFFIQNVNEFMQSR